MPRSAKNRAVTASEHDDFFALVLGKLHMASEEGRILGRLYKLDSGAREGAHLGAILRFVADYVVEGGYDERQVVLQLKEAFAESHLDADADADEDTDRDSDPGPMDEDDDG